jgi:hypothetical protein
MAIRSEFSDSAPSKSAHSHRARPRRYEPVAVYALANTLKREGVDLHNFPGPWRPIRRVLRRPGRNAERAVPIVTNGSVEIAVDTAEHAADLSGFLNSAGLEHLDPVPNLRPPEQDLVREGNA